MTKPKPETKPEKADIKRGWFCAWCRIEMYPVSKIWKHDCPKTPEHVLNEYAKRTR